MPMRLRLHNGDTIREFEFDRPQVAVGRGPLNDIAIASPSLAQRAGQLELRGGELTFDAHGVDGFLIRMTRGGETVHQSDGEAASWALQPGDVLYFERDEAETSLAILSSGLTEPIGHVELIELAPDPPTESTVLVEAIAAAANDPGPATILRAAAGLIHRRAGVLPQWVAITLDPNGEAFNAETLELHGPKLEGGSLARGIVKPGPSPLRMLGVHGLEMLEALSARNVAACAARDGCTLAVPVHGPQGIIAVLTAHLGDEVDSEAADACAHALHELDGLARLCLDNQSLTRRANALSEENRYFRERQRRHYLFKELVCESPAMRETYDALNQLVTSTGPVLILGEAGTGKELLARALHHLNDRRHGMLISLNGARLAEDTVDVELFGSVKSQLSGAMADRKGAFELAEGGTVYLAEVDQLSPLMQGKLARMLKEGEIRRVGDSESRPVNARLIVSLHRDLNELVREGRLRRDLYLALKAHTLEVPALRDRGEDIMPLARTFLRKFAKRYDKKATQFSPDVEARFLSYDWPGNARELQTRIESATLKSKTSRITFEDIQL